MIAIKFAECEHQQFLMNAEELANKALDRRITHGWPRVNFPMDDENSIDAGDEMTCVTCGIVRTVGKAKVK